MKSSERRFRSQQRQNLTSPLSCSDLSNGKEHQQHTAFKFPMHDYSGLFILSQYLELAYRLCRLSFTHGHLQILLVPCISLFSAQSWVSYDQVKAVRAKLCAQIIHTMGLLDVGDSNKNLQHFGPVPQALLRG